MKKVSPAPQKVVGKEINEIVPIIDVFVDGASHQDKKTVWAFIAVRGDKKIIHQVSGVLRGDICKMFQVGGELKAVMKAVEWAKENNYKININYDLEGTRFWMDGSWRCKNKWTQEYKKFVNENHEVINSWVKVTAHSGNHYHEMTDKLAGETLNSQ